jgi:hypothetical protein
MRVLSKIDKYLTVQEKSDAISVSQSNNLEDAIEMIKESENIEETLKLFNDDIRERIQKLIDGGII